MDFLQCNNHQKHIWKSLNWWNVPLSCFDVFDLTKNLRLFIYLLQTKCIDVSSKEFCACTKFFVANISTQISLQLASYNNQLWPNICDIWYDSSINNGEKDWAPSDLTQATFNGGFTYTSLDHSSPPVTNKLNKHLTVGRNGIICFNKCKPGKLPGRVAIQHGRWGSSMRVFLHEVCLFIWPPDCGLFY